MAITEIVKRKSHIRKFMVKMPEEEYVKLKQLADNFNRSMNMTIVQMIRYGHEYFVKGGEMTDRKREVI